MKIAVSSVGKDKNSEISPAVGRAPYYLIFEEEKLVKVIKNPFAVGGGGAGFGVAQMLGNEGVKLVISGKFGENMKGALESKGIKFKEVSGKKVKEALEKEK
jgi:predicted Fe-Mo cluster-binding NifX family protein